MYTSHDTKQTLDYRVPHKLSKLIRLIDTVNKGHTIWYLGGGGGHDSFV